VRELNFNKITCQIYTLFWYCVTKFQAKRIFFLKLAFFLKFELLHGVTKMASSTNGLANYHWWVLSRQWSRRYIRLSQPRVFNFKNHWDMFFDPIVWLGDFGKKIVYQHNLNKWVPIFWRWHKNNEIFNGSIFWNTHGLVAKWRPQLRKK